MKHDVDPDEPQAERALPRPAIERQAARGLAQLFERTRSMQQGWGCDDSAECCRLAKFGHEPWVWPLEWRRIEGALATQRRSLPLAPLQPGDCALLTAEGRCSIHADRPLACRSFFCGRGRGPRAITRTDIDLQLKQLAALSAESDPHIPGPRRLARLLSGEETFHGSEEGEGRPEGEGDREEGR